MSTATHPEPPEAILLLPLEAEAEPAPVRRAGLVRRGWWGVASAMEWLFGFAALFVGLAVLASVPVGQFLALGYLLEVSGRVSRTGRLRDGFIGVRTAARFGGIALGGVLLWLPLYGMSIMAEAARIIDPKGPISRQWELGLTILAVLFAVHFTEACLRGGKLRYFFRPLNVVWFVRRVLRGGAFQEARDKLWDTVVTLRLPYYFTFGSLGFVGALLWLALPVALLGSGHKVPILGVIGAVMLVIVVLYLPFLQARFARDNRFRAYRELRAVRTEFGRAPLAFAFALWLQLLAAVPLYLLKIETIPRDLVFLEGMLFLAFLFPARLVAGWAYSRPARRTEPRHWVFRWVGRLLVLPAAFVYVLAVFFSLHTGWHGVVGLFNQHAFQLPVPFVAGS